MVNFIEISLRLSSAEPWKDVLIAMLAEKGFESFAEGEDETEVLAYISTNAYQPKEVEELLLYHGLPIQLTYAIQEIESKDWNKEWESNYAPVLIANRCYIRAPFHETMPSADVEIVIEPKMSFGTAHHETTALMIELLLDEDLQGKSLLDMGAGTGVLAILAHKKGSTPIVAIDNDEWAYHNNIENNERNKVSNVEVRLGNVKAIKTKEQFDVIVANINRNVLLNDIPRYANALKQKGVLLLSGFYLQDDLKMIEQQAAEHNLMLNCYKEKNRWVAAKFTFMNLKK